MPPTVVTANRLADGSVVFLNARLEWVRSFRDAEVFAEGRDSEALQHAKRDEAEQIVVDPYAVEVVQRDGAVVPKALREAIRAAGPTVRVDLNVSRA